MATSSSWRSSRWPSAATASPAWSWRAGAATSSSSGTAFRVTGCGPWSRAESAVTLRPGRWSCRPPARTASTPSPTTPACPGRCSPTGASWRSSRRRSTRRCGGSGASTASSWSRSSRRWSSGATATSSSTRSGRSAASWPAASTPPARGRRSSRSTTACWPPSAATMHGGPPWRLCARSACPPTTAAPTPASCATSWSARAGAPATSRSAWSPRRGRSTAAPSRRRWWRPAPPA